MNGFSTNEQKIHNCHFYFVGKATFIANWEVLPEPFFW